MNIRSLAGRGGGLVLCLLAAVAMPAGRGTGRAGTVQTTYATGLERSEGKQTTTREEELALLTAVAANSPRMRFDVVGESTNGEALHLVRLGHPKAPDDAAVDRGRNLLFVGAQHGNEPAGREGLLRLIRDLAFTKDPDLVRQLSAMNILIIPTANPDGVVAKTRRTAAGVDCNRDHLDLKTPEARTIASVILRTSPEILVDAHEGGSAPERPEQTVRLEALWPSHLNTDADVRRLSREMIETHIFPAIQALGLETATWRGRGDRAGVLRNMAGLRHSVGMVTESFRSTAAERGALQFRALHEVLRFQRERGDEIAAAVRAARERAAVAGAARTGPVYLAGTDQEAPKPEQVLASPPAGYLLNAVQKESIAPQIAGFGLTVEEVRPGSFFVPIAQPMGSVVPLMLDPRADGKRTKGLPVETAALAATLDPPPLPPPPSPPARHFADFSTLDPGASPREWRQPWRSGQWVIERELRVLRQQAEKESGRRALTWQTPGVLVGDVEVLARVRGKSAATLFQLALHLSGEPGSENAYYVDVRLPAGQFRINRYIEGRFTTLKTAPFPGDPEAWHMVRFRREGSRLMARIWADGAAEPESWTLTAVDDTHQSGEVGLVGMQPKSVTDWAFLGVGVGGENAPRMLE